MEEGTTKQKFLKKNIRRIIWGDRKGHQKDVEQKKGAKQKQKKEITPEEITKILRKIRNWKAPDLDFVQGFWLKSFRSIPEGL